jgi:hypothetical protein
MFTSKAAPISAGIRRPRHPSQTSENCVAGSYTSIAPARSSAKWDRVYGLCDEASLSPWLDDRAACFRTEGKSTALALGIDFKVRSPLIQSALQCLGDCKEVIAAVFAAMQQEMEAIAFYYGFFHAHRLSVHRSAWIFLHLSERSPQACTRYAATQKTAQTST